MYTHTHAGFTTTSRPGISVIKFELEVILRFLWWPLKRSTWSLTEYSFLNGRVFFFYRKLAKKKGSKSRLLNCRMLQMVVNVHQLSSAQIVITGIMQEF